MGRLGGGSNTPEDATLDIFAGANDPTSFNHFRNFLFHLAGADTIVMPDSVITNQTRERGWDGAAGVGWRFGRGLVGGEFHLIQDRFENTLAGFGPERRRWDVRAGAEVRATRNLWLRLGGMHGRDDRDRLTDRNEFLNDAA